MLLFAATWLGSELMLSVRFLNWWPGLVPEQSFIFQLLKKALQCDLSVVLENSARVDIEVHSVFTRSTNVYREAFQAARVRLGQKSFQEWRLARDYGIGQRGPADHYVWYSGENLRPPPGWDATLSFDLDDFSGTNHYLPHWAIRTTDLGWRDPNDPLATSSAVLETSREISTVPSKFACLLASNPHPMREQLADRLQKVGPVDRFGRAFGKPVASKAELLSQYRFVIAPENDLYPGYVTEKAIEAWLTTSIPIWWGLDTAGYLNQDALVNAASNSIDDVADIVNEVNRSEEVWAEKASRPILANRYDYNKCAEFLKYRLT